MDQSVEFIQSVVCVEAIMSYLTVVTAVVLILLFYFIKKKDTAPLFGVYSQPGKWYWLKYIIFSCLYYYRKGEAIWNGDVLCNDCFQEKAKQAIYHYLRLVLKKRMTNSCDRYSSKNKAVGTEGLAGQGVRALADPADMDRAQPLSDNAKAFDAIFFISAKRDEQDKSDKGIYVVAGCERRPMGMCNGLFYIGLPDKGLLCSKKIPDTVLFGAQIGEFAAEGINITPMEPMKKWTIAYKGQMWYQNEPSKLVDVEFLGEWTSRGKYFDYDTELHPPAIIKSIAREPWSKQYFEGLKTAHQSHYEQFGTLKCKCKIDNEELEFVLPSFRDHSFGHKRDWSLMHRYIFHHIFLNNGLSISIGVISQPTTASSMEAGVVGLPNGEMVPVEWIDLQLYQHGEGGTPPKDYAFTFKAGDEIYTVQVLVEYESVHYVSDEWEARMVERFCKFIVNGVPGRGVNEFHYRHKDGRPESVAKNDPEWYRKMCHKI